MKFIILTTLLTLAACAKDPIQQLNAVNATPASNAASLAQTEKLDEATAIRAASAAALASPNSLPAATVLRCWQREELRPRIRDACLLAWAAAGQDSSELNDILRKALTQPTRTLALAAARRDGFAARLSMAELLPLISSLHNEAPWIRAKAALDWLSRNSPASLIEANQLFTALNFPDSEGAPITLASKFAVSRKLGLEKEAAWLRSDYCIPGISGVAVTRCLRILSALINTRFGAPAPYVHASLPSPKDQGTIYFQRSFPTRAHYFDNLY